MSKIHQWQTVSALAENLGVSEGRIRNAVGPGVLIETRPFTPTELDAMREARLKMGVKGRGSLIAFRVKAGITREMFQLESPGDNPRKAKRVASKEVKPKKDPKEVSAKVRARPDPLPLPEIPPREREPIALRLKGAPPDSPPIGYLFADPPQGAVKPMTIMPATLTYRTGNAQDFTEKVAELIARAFPEVGVVTVAVGLDMEMYSARHPRSPS